MSNEKIVSAALMSAQPLKTDNVVQIGIFDANFYEKYKNAKFSKI